MHRIIFSILISIPTLVFSQDNQKLMRLKELDFNSFPTNFEVTQKVFEYYYNIGFTHKQIDSLNETQKVLCYNFICGGLIDNSGFYSILTETHGEYNIGYSKALELIQDTTDKKIFDEIVSIYEKYEKWFSKQEYPPTLDEESKEFDKKLYNRIEELQKNWYRNEEIREKLFEDYLTKEKHLLVDKE